MGVTVPEIISAVKCRTRSTRPDKSAASRPGGQEFTYTVRAQGRLVTARSSADRVRANPDGSVVRLKDVARIELGAQTITSPAVSTASPRRSGLLSTARLQRRTTADAVDKKHGRIEKSFPPDIDYDVPLDTTKSVTEGIQEIVETLLKRWGW